MVVVALGEPGVPVTCCAKTDSMNIADRKRISRPHLIDRIRMQNLPGLQLVKHSNWSTAPHTHGDNCGRQRQKPTRASCLRYIVSYLFRWLNFSVGWLISILVEHQNSDNLTGWGHMHGLQAEASVVTAIYKFWGTCAYDTIFCEFNKKSICNNFLSWNKHKIKKCKDEIKGFS